MYVIPLGCVLWGRMCNKQESRNLVLGCGILLFVWNKVVVCFYLSLGFWYYRYEALVLTAFLVAYNAVSQGVESVILAYADIFAGIVLGATLANYNVAGYHFLPPKNLDAESL